MGGAYFFSGQELIDLAACIKNGWLKGAHGVGALSVAVHVALVGGGGERQMPADEA